MRINRLLLCTVKVNGSVMKEQGKKMDIRAMKTELRRKMRLRNEKVPADRLEAASNRIMMQLIELPEFREAQSVFCYVSAEHEIRTWEILHHAMKCGKKVCVPKCDGHGFMEARQIHRLEELQAGFQGILEAPANSVPVDHPDLCIIPCIACDMEGYRLGHGGGYYDRYLFSHPGMPTILLAGSWQVCNKLPHDPWDQKADRMLTENEQSGRIIE